MVTVVALSEVIPCITIIVCSMSGCRSQDHKAGLFQAPRAFSTHSGTTNSYHIQLSFYSVCFHLQALSTLGLTCVHR